MAPPIDPRSKEGESIRRATEQSEAARRRQGSDRSDLLHDSVRNVQVSKGFAANDPRYDAGEKKSIDVDFNQRYPDYRGIERRAITDQPKKNAAPAAAGAAAPPEPTYQSQEIAPRRRRSLKKRLLGVGKQKKKTPFSKAKARVVTFGIWSWAFPSWFLFQLPFAIASVLFFGLAAAQDAARQAMKAAIEDSSWVIRKGAEFLKFVGEKIADVVGVLEDILDFDLTGMIAEFFDLTNYFIAMHIIVSFFGIVTLLSIFLVYKLHFLEPLGGEKAGSKISCFLLAIAGYALPIPFLNFLPWFLPWTWVVMRNPK